MTPATPLVESKSFMAPPDPAAGKLIEPSMPASSLSPEPPPVIVAAAPANDSVEPDAARARLQIRERDEVFAQLGEGVCGLRDRVGGIVTEVPRVGQGPIVGGDRAVEGAAEGNASS